MPFEAAFDFVIHEIASSVHLARTIPKRLRRRLWPFNDSLGLILHPCASQICCFRMLSHVRITSIVSRTSFYKQIALRRMRSLGCIRPVLRRCISRC
jgi:hypothetical protein